MTTDTMLKDYSRLRKYMEESVRVKADPWVVVGTTTIDGDNETIAEAFGLEVHGLLGVIQALREDGRVLQAGGRNVRIHDTNIDPEHGGIVECDIVRHKSEIDAERRAHIDFVSKWAADPWRIRPTVMRQVCQECGPHGNTGRVLLLESWVDCTTCMGFDEWNNTEAEYNDADIRAGIKMVYEAMPAVGAEVSIKAVGR